ncbi:molybdopterin molybdotransferase MoeA [Campylobacter sp. 2018MI35]|uniref:molybdopterin molybdotransferase MoeA n=1 Tax=Campylobacter sp. 2018MI34 TaxID=2800582 RepID=UPI001908361D|nr:molybdopterin molybdotransferase MoeA [Campylobacter sp. 2018MI34]MBK1992148.1 molybdopterin molybdotransferase MoeA [Campylobacter sp. 2018MI34]
MKNIFQTLEILEKNIKSINEFEIISLENAKDRFLFEDIKSKKNLPSFDNAALDGYAFRFEDRFNALSVKGTILAGDKEDKKIEQNECYKIMTGSKIPSNADTIIMLEDAFLENDKLIIKKDIKQYNAYRFKAEELKEGEIILKKGEKLDSAKITLLASQGIYKIKVFRKIKIGIFSSGNELKEPWQECDKDAIYNANALGIFSLLLCPSCEISYLGIIKDNFLDTKEALEFNNFDLLLTSGGASAGEADFMEEALKKLNFIPIFQGIKARPAKPSKLYCKDKNYILILPGNPMAAYLSCFILALKIIHLFCCNTQSYLSIEAKMGKDLKLKSGRNNLILGNLEQDFFYPIEQNFGSGMIMPLIKNNFLFISNEEQEYIKQNEKIKIILL